MAGAHSILKAEYAAFSEGLVWGLRENSLRVWTEKLEECDYRKWMKTSDNEEFSFEHLQLEHMEGTTMVLLLQNLHSMQQKGKPIISTQLTMTRLGTGVKPGSGKMGLEGRTGNSQAKQKRDNVPEKEKVTTEDKKQHGVCAQACVQRHVQCIKCKQGG